MKSTDELLKILKNYNNIEEFIEDNTEDIKNNYAYQIFSGSKKPSRNKVLALSISMGLDTDATNRLLKLSDHSILYPRIKRDSIIHFSLEQHYNLIDTNILLHDMEEKIIE